MHAVKIARALDGGQQFIGYNVTVSRSGAGKSLDGVKLILKDVQDNSVSSKDIPETIKPLDKKHYLVSSDAGFTPAQVTVIPFFMKKSGEVYYCENPQVDELAVSE